MNCTLKDGMRTCSPKNDMKDNCFRCGFNSDIIDQRKCMLDNNGLTYNPETEKMFLYVGAEELPNNFKSGYVFEGIN